LFWSTGGAPIAARSQNRFFAAGGRVNITQNLAGIDFPANKRQRVQHAEKNGAESDVIDAIQSMPDTQFETMANVMKAYGESNEERRH